MIGTSSISTLSLRLNVPLGEFKIHAKTSYLNTSEKFLTKSKLDRCVAALRSESRRRISCMGCGKALLLVSFRFTGYYQMIWRVARFCTTPCFNWVAYMTLQKVVIQHRSRPGNTQVRHRSLSSQANGAKPEVSIEITPASGGGNILQAVIPRQTQVIYSTWIKFTCADRC